MKQTKTGSLIEQIANIITSMAISLALQPHVYAMFGIYTSFLVNFYIVITLTSISLIKGYVIRRWFNKKQKNPHQTKFESFVEASFQTLTGYVLSLIFQMIVFPLFGVKTSIINVMGIVLIFTFISIIRSFLFRRLFQQITMYFNQKAIDVGREA